MRPRRRKGIYSRRTPFGAMRLTSAPPNVSCVICCANNLYPSGPSPYPCPGVDTPSGIDTLSPMPRAHKKPSNGDNVLRGTKTIRRQILSAEIDQKDRDIGGGDSGDAGGLGDGSGTVAFEFLTTFNREAVDFVKVKIRRNLDIL